MAVWELAAEYAKSQGLPDDTKFDDTIRARVGDPLKYIRYATVAGANYPNDDGSSRLQIIASCKRGEELILENDPLSEFPLGMMVKRKGGAQVGWIDSWLGAEMVAENAKCKRPMWMCFFLRKHVEGDEVIGGKLCLVRLSIRRLPKL